MDREQIIERFIYRTGVGEEMCKEMSEEIAVKYLGACDGVLNTAVILYRADRNEGKVMK